MSTAVYLRDNKAPRTHLLGKYNEGRASQLSILCRVFRVNKLDTLGCVTDYSLVIGRSAAEVPLYTLKHLMYK